MNFRHCCFLLLLLAPHILPAQNILVSEAMSIRNDYGYEMIGRLRERILLFRDKDREFEVQAFDNQMQLSWSRELTELDKSGVQVLSVIGSRNDFSVIFKQRKRGVSTLKVYKFDAGAKLIDTLTVKTYAERFMVSPFLDIIRSEDKNCFLVFNPSERQTLETVCFRLDKMKVLWDKTIFIKDSDSESNTKHMALSNEGDFFLVNEINNRRNKVEDHELNVLHINGPTEHVTRVAMPGYLSSDLKFGYDNRNKRLVGAGLYAEKNRDRAQGYFFTRVTPGEPTATVRFEAFDDSFISILRQKDVEDDNKGITESDVQQLIIREDGGVLMVVERHHEIQRGAVSGRGFWRDGMRMVVDYYFDDIYIIAIHPDGQTHWKTVLHKKQYSQDDESTFSSYFLFKSKDKVRFLFNDEIKYENTCSEYIVSPLGEFDRNSVMSTAGQNLRLRFRDAVQLNDNECLVPSEFRNKLKLVLLRY